MKVKLLGFDDRGKVRLSMKVVDQQTGEDLEGKQRAEGDQPHEATSGGRRGISARREVKALLSERCNSERRPECPLSCCSVLLESSRHGWLLRQSLFAGRAKRLTAS